MGGGVESVIAGVTILAGVLGSGGMKNACDGDRQLVEVTQLQWYWPRADDLARARAVCKGSSRCEAVHQQRSVAVVPSQRILCLCVGVLLVGVACHVWIAGLERGFRSCHVS